MKSQTTKRFWQAFDGLPRDVQKLAFRAYVLWRTNSRHPGLHFKCINERHGVYSVRIGIHWRAIGFRVTADEETYTWFWIGSHADYDRLIAGM